MKKVIIVHGFGGSPNGGWRSWLMGQLAEADVYACALPMPSPETPVLEAWIEEIRRVVEREGTETYLVGHSLGVPSILRYLERASEGTRIAGAVLVAGLIEKTDVNHLVDSFVDAPFDFEAIRGRIGRTTVVHALDDDRVSFAQGERLARELGAELITIEKGGHLNGKAGWKTLPQCLEALKGMMA